MTELLNAEFEDDDGERRRLTRDGDPRLPQPHRRRRQRDHHPADRLDRQGARRAPRPAARSSWPTAASSPAPSRSCSASRRPHRCRPATSRRTSSSTARRCPAGSAIAAAERLGQPRRPQVRRRRPLRHPPQDRPPPDLRLRHPLLPRRRAGPPRGPGRPRRGAAALPRVGGRLGQRRAGPHLDGARLGDAPGHDAVERTRRPGLGRRGRERPSRPLPAERRVPRAAEGRLAVPRSAVGRPASRAGRPGARRRRAEGSGSGGAAVGAGCGPALADSLRRRGRARWCGWCRRRR